ncbi:AlpA family phage regulatory protein [Rhizobium phaseoli]|uniref:helix-turn-helix transcriptional regulator n=1 Tax=Rhizobium phaseoli TaxID=396 RepID=UPI000F894063|nr:AlpA family phage regulatory protein [Rhizobium phaseoli]RUM16834.1 AlpA family phage regulatory protein [Rhizobium phaseoli]
MTEKEPPKKKKSRKRRTPPPSPILDPHGFLTLQQVCALTGLSRWTLQKMWEHDLFPRPVPLTIGPKGHVGKNGFAIPPVYRWLADRAAGAPWPDRPGGKGRGRKGPRRNPPR